ncbi:uncharacterized protein LOC134288803 [Aedes albopictus]|uniref:Endonuclease/exonuclease/phosphatase domain-containing protein n=1 Tax=Aedes albopictus TaxID=7160 RepID=A0ABM1XVK7_AEDAL
MYVYFQNVRGLRTKINELFLAVDGSEYDVIVLVETNLDSTITSAQLFGEHYVVYRNDRDTTNSQKKSGGGVLIAVHRKLPSSLIRCATEGFELVLTRVHIANSYLFICAGYIPPELRSNPPFVKRFGDAICDSLRPAGNDDLIVVCGDFNQANLVWKQSESSFITADPVSVGPASACLLDNMAMLNLNQFCFVTNPWNHILDLVFANTKSCVIAEAAVPLVKIDRPHPPLEITLLVGDSEPLFEHEDTLPLNYKRIDFASLNNFLARIDWTEVLTCSDVDVAVQNYTDVIANWLSSNVPKKRLPAKPPWGNARLRSLKREKNACQRHYRRLRTPLFKQRFQTASNAYKSLNSHLYMQYVDNVQNSLRHNPKRFWNYVNSKRKQNDGIN